MKRDFAIKNSRFRMFWVHKVMDELNECGLGYGLSGLYTQNVMEFIQNQIIAIRAGSKIHHKHIDLACHL